MNYATKTVLATALIGFVWAGCGGSPTINGANGPQPAPVFVAVGAKGSIVTSHDGMTWTATASGVSTDLNSIATGQSIFVAVGAGGAILTSRDGAAWTRRDAQTTTDLSHVIFNGEKFIAVGGDWNTGAATLKSIDGMTWTAVDSPSSYMFHAVAYGAGTMVAAAYFRSDLQTPAVFTAAVSSGSASVEGWRKGEGPDFFDSVTVNGEILVVDGTAIAASRDGVTWTARNVSAPGLLRAIGFGGSQFAVVGERGGVFTSPNGTDWSERPALGTKRLDGVAFGGARLVVVGEKGTIGTSADGAAWTTPTSRTDNDLFDVAYGPANP